MRPHVFLAALCFGIALSNAVRLPIITASTLAVAFALISRSTRRHVALAGVLLLVGWSLGSLRLDRLDQSVLRSQIGRAERALVVVTAAPRRRRFDLAMPVRVIRFGRLRPDEQAQLELPLGRAPPAGGILAVRVEAKLPRGSSQGFDERTWLRRHGVHVTLAGDWWRLVGHRGGLGGLGDRVHRWLGRSVGGRLR